MSDRPPDDLFSGTDPNDPFLQTFKEIYAKADPERRKYLRDMASKTGIRTDRARVWVIQFTKLAQLIHKRGKRAESTTIELFWIRLYGVLAELPNVFSGLAKHAHLAPNNPWLQAAAAIHRIALEMRAAFSDDEIILLDLMRQMASHVQQRGYEIRWQADANKADDSRKIDLLGGQRFTIAKVEERINAALKAHGDNIGFAVAIVDRLQTKIAELYAATKVWSYDPRSKV